MKKMNPEEPTPQEEDETFYQIATSIYQSLRESIFPVKPSDNILVKIGKETGFLIFGTLAFIVSLVISLAASLVL